MRRGLLLLALASCVSTGPRAPPPTNYDFGLAAAAAAVAAPIDGSLTIVGVEAPEWLATDGIVYRLAYENAARPEVYALSRWVAPPSELVTQRLVQRLASVAKGGVVSPATGIRTEWSVRVELEEFSQLFDAPGRSRAIVRLRATLVDARGGMVAQEVFAAARAARPDAPGAVTSLREATDEVIDLLAQWLVREAVAGAPVGSTAGLPAASAP